MSNCDFVAGGSLIHLAASRLALRAPAQRAATALIRPSRSAQRLPRSRHSVPTAKTVGPNNIVTNHCVERGDHLTHHRHDHNLGQLASEGARPPNFRQAARARRRGGRISLGHEDCCICSRPVMALFGRASRAKQCPVSGAKQPCRRNLETAEFDPLRTSAAFAAG
jgi:hypothetical protein